MQIIESLRALFTRDLDRLIDEIEAYQTETNIWVVDQQISNCAGNLALHLVGNLNTFIGAVIGQTGYIRQRELEFSRKDVPKSELIDMISETKAIVDQSLQDMDPPLLNTEYPIMVFKEPQTYQHFLIHLTVHLGYHLGQINYHRRLLDI